MVGKIASQFVAPDEKETKLNYSSLAQSVEHLTVNQGVAGSSPAGGANKKRTFVIRQKCVF